jgi:membrane associated rhomboid family serine protease
MIPLHDSNPTRTTPLLTIGLIIVNVLAWLLELSQEGQGQLNEFVVQWAIVPAELLSQPLQELPTVFTSMFLHGSWGHLIGNMLYLWVFGDNIEDRMGRVRYLLFYLVSGIVAAGLQIAFDPDSRVPLVGASGAIAGVMGGYLLLYPRARIMTLVGYFRTNVPAVLVLGFWIVFQFFGGVGSLSGTEQGGVAFFAHIGGFVAGMLLVKPFLIGRPDPGRRMVEDDYQRRY